MVGSCLSNMASEYFYLKSCRKHRFPEASIHSDSSTLCSYQVAWILCAIMERKNCIYTEITLCCYHYDYQKKTLNKISLHPNQTKTKKPATENREYDLEGEWQKKSLLCYLMFRKWIHQCLTLWSNINQLQLFLLRKATKWLKVKGMQNKY